MRGCRGDAWLPGGGGHAWLWGACVVAGGACMVAGGHAWLPGGMHGCQGACVVAGGHAWLLGGIHGGWLGGGHGCQGACMVYDEIRSMSGRYTSLLECTLVFVLILKHCGDNCLHY